MDITSISRMLTDARARAGLSQRELAERAGTSQPALARLETGNAAPRFDTLRRLLEAAGFDLRMELVPKATRDAVIDAYKRDVDRTLLRENLKKSVDQRLRALADLQLFDKELRRAMKARRASGA